MAANASRTSERERRIDEVIAAYLAADAVGRAPNRDELLARYPDIATDLKSFFADHDAARKLGKPDIPTPDLSTLGLSESLSTSNLGTIRYIGDYELLQEIARGGMGIVYKARQVSLNRVVALKMILAGQLAGPADVRRFRVEAEAAAGLDHPGIVPIYEVGEFDGQHYFSMSFVDGDSLAARIAAGPMPPRDAAELVREVAEAVHYAHGRGVIHRDLKPANVLIARNGRPRVTDFGLAKQVGNPTELTATGQILGTPNFMPPEQASGELNKVGPPSDVYSLGAILYTLVTGRPPFQAGSVVDTLMLLRSEEPIPPRRLNPHLARDLETICLRCLQKDPAQRYESAQALADDLGRFLNGEAIHARPVGVLERSARWVRRKRKPILIGSAIAVSTIIVVFVLTAGWRAYQHHEVASQSLAFLNALDARDDQAIDAMLTEKARQAHAVGEIDSYKGEPGTKASFEITRVELTGDDARAEAIAHRDGRRQDLTLRLRRANGAWLVHGIDSDGQGIRTYKNLESDAIAYFPTEAPPTPPLEALTPEQFDALWKIDLKVDGEPVGAVIERLARELGLSVVKRDDQRDLFLRRIRVNRPGCSRMEAIELLAKEVGMDPRYEGKRLSFTNNVGSRPVVYAGPFLIRVDSVTQFAPHAVGYTSVSARAYGLPESLLSDFQQQIVVEEVAATRNGPSLQDERAQYGGDWATERGVYHAHKSVAMKNLLHDVKHVTLSGHVPVRLPTRVEKVRFEPVAAGATKELGEIRITINGIGTKDPCALSLRLDRVTYKDVQILAYDPNGKLIPSDANRHFGSDEQSFIEQTLRRVPAAIEAVVVTESKDVQYAFRFDGVAMPDADKMPEKLTPATFTGHEAPVSIEFVRIAERGNFSKIRLRVVNHANKPVRHLAMTHVYLDAAGKPLKEFPASHSGPTRSGPAGVIVGPGESREFDNAAFFMPPEAQGARVIVRSVEFADATEWRADFQRP